MSEKQTEPGWKEKDGQQVCCPMLMESFLDTVARACERADSIQQEVALQSRFVDLMVIVRPGQSVGHVEKIWYKTLQNFCRPYEKKAREVDIVTVLRFPRLDQIQKSRDGQK